MNTIIKNGRIINPATGVDEISDLYIVDDKISEIGRDIRGSVDLVLDATGCFVMPGFIDLHVHFREPGYEYKETILTGSRAAIRGGFTTVCVMPNTNPVTDNPDTVDYINKKAQQAGLTNVLVVGAVTKGQIGKELSEIKAMKKAGICAISEDGKSVMNEILYKEAMKIAVSEGIPVFAHCEEINLVNGGVINLGNKSFELGLKGISNESEDVIIKRDIELAKETGARLHICHISTRQGLEIIREAKERGLNVSAEVCPHHFTLTEDDIVEGDSNYKMNPPLRKKEDREALLKGLKDNVFEVIATDHAPHQKEEKDQSLNLAPFGIVGLETALPLTVSELLHKGIITPMQMAEKLSYNPSKILGIDKGDISCGKVADITVINPDTEYNIDVSRFESKSKNTPFNGRSVKGKVVYTIVNGKVVYSDDK